MTEAREGRGLNPDKTEGIRQNYIEAMAVALGTNPLTAQLSALGLMARKSELTPLWQKNKGKRHSEYDPEELQTVEAIGAWLLSNPHREEREAKLMSTLHFTVGSHALQLACEEAEALNLTTLKKRLREKIQIHWEVDAEGLKRFDEISGR